VFLPINETTVLGATIDQILASKLVKEVIIATPDDQIVEYAKANGIRYFKGSEENVLERFLECAKFFKLEHIVRITADCPLIDPQIIDETLGLYLCSGAFEYVNNFSKKFLEGQACEVFSFEVLQQMNELACTAHDREHVTPMAYNIPGLFRVGILVPPYDYSLKLTVDEQQDYDLVKKIYSNITNRPITIPDILKIHDEL
jgi:spore coat polysaccharide biosynthesis protein SpsF